MFSIPALDDLSTLELHSLVHRWFDAKCETLADPIAVDQAFNLFMPRSIFLKNLPENSKILDVGAGEGALAIQKQWPMFPRQDLKMYALSLEVGPFFHLYETFEIKNFETDPDIFPGIEFDAMICAHFIEHMSEPAQSIEFFARRIRSGGRLYLEWPHPFTKKLPTSKSLSEQGFDVMTFNFFDDGTHIETWPVEMLLDLLKKNGFVLETGGRVYLPWIGEQMRDHARPEKDKIRLTIGSWAALGWAQYLVLNRT
jgi:2-polyprenyl-3-methyl-5-hydroxy-6-metoxy-1,4-benzoquinol methylase